MDCLPIQYTHILKTEGTDPFRSNRRYLCGVAAGDRGWVASVADTTDVSSIPRMYLISFYWSFTTMTTVGFGDITGSTGIEQGFSIFAMGIGGFTFALIVGGIGDLITRDGVAETAYLQMMGELKEFLFSKSVPKDLGARVVAFHERLYSNRTVFDEQKIFERLPEMLRSEVVLHMYGGVMRRVPLFHALTDRTLADVCLELKAYHATTGEAFTVEGECADKMFVIKSGMVRGFPNHHVPPTDGPDCPDCLLTVWSTGPTLSNPSYTSRPTDPFFCAVPGATHRGRHGTAFVADEGG